MLSRALSRPLSWSTRCSSSSSASSSSSSSACLLCPLLPSHVVPSSLPITSPTSCHSRVYSSSTHPHPPMKASKQGVVGDQLSHTLHLAHASIGQVIDMPYELTMDSAHTQAWMSSFYAYDRLYTSTPFAQSLNFTTQVLPYTMVLFKAVSMGHVDENRAVLDLGFDNAVYVRPAYAGETFKQTFTIKHLRQTSDGDNTIMTVGCELVNQKGQLVFSVDKAMLYPHVTPLSKISVAPLSRPAPPTSHLLAHILYNGDNLPGTSHLANLRAGQLVLHSVARPIGNAANMALSTLFRWTHPTIYNMKRYSENERVVPGGLVLAATIGASSRGLFEMLHEQIDHCSFLNKVSPVDLIGAVSYVTQIKSIQEGFEEVRITTLGLKNIDIAKELKGVSIPIELFTEPLRPHQLESFLKTECPILADKIVVQAQRRLVRQSPYSQQVNIPLL